MENYIVVMKSGDVLHGSGYTAMLRRLQQENKVDKIINISNSTEPRVYNKCLGQWIKLNIVC